jgi:hypothetical protein
VLDRLRRRASRSRSPHGGDGPTASADPASEGEGAGADLGFDAARLEAELIWLFATDPDLGSWLTATLTAPALPDPGPSCGFKLSGDGGSVTAIPVSRLSLTRHLAPAFGDPIGKNGNELFPATLNNYMADKPAYLFSTAASGRWRVGARRLALRRLHSALVSAREEHPNLAPAPRMVVDESTGAYAADLLASLMPRSRLLVVTGDPQDELGPLPRCADGPGGGRDAVLQRAAREWCCRLDAIARAHSAFSPERRLAVRREELEDDPLEAVGRVAAWARLGPSDERNARAARGLEPAGGGSDCEKADLTDIERERLRRLTDSQRERALTLR